ncbi:hypothetical protein GCM10007382_26510 [Salinibacterium xinjiangense]|uniref:Uncharacterized protein n=1 Tax=Salinibacterium xinjiangense TaxID=386302 RepID=A0A2C8ZVK4_9MICO|nr:hypothetical protein [Salinibacterium xinjiangense]GGL05298.1 hypothetical protein GCM10007382_26510 [Salinibacterium xinjiangense]SOE69788.1 hypothetical protein SAMN06296378_2058 [Salinibacterium xinjiangense]
MTERSSDKYASRLLLEGEWLPVTSTILFIHAPVEHCVETLVSGVRGVHVRREFGKPLVPETVSGSLPALLANLVPLDSSQDRRNLLLATADASWTAMFGSNWRGFDPHSAMSWFGAARIETVAISGIPNAYESALDKGFYGERKIESYEIPSEGEPVGQSLGVRMSEPRKWELVSPSASFRVGNVWNPAAKRITDRFTHDHLSEMANRYGLRPFDADFFAPEGSGVLVSRTDAPQPDESLISLAIARGER